MLLHRTMETCTHCPRLGQKMARNRNCGSGSFLNKQIWKREENFRKFPLLKYYLSIDENCDKIYPIENKNYHVIIVQTFRQKWLIYKRKLYCPFFLNNSYIFLKISS